MPSQRNRSPQLGVGIDHFVYLSKWLDIPLSEHMVYSIKYSINFCAADPKAGDFIQCADIMPPMYRRGGESIIQAHRRKGACKQGSEPRLSVSRKSA